MPSATAKPNQPEALKRPMKATNEIMGQFGVGTNDKLARPQEIAPDGTARYKTFNAAGAVASYRSTQLESLNTAVKSVITEHANTDNAGAPLLAQKTAFKETLQNWQNQATISFNHFIDQVENQLTSIAKQQQALDGKLNPIQTYNKLDTEKNTQLAALKEFHANELRELNALLDSTDFNNQLQALNYDSTRRDQTKESLRQGLLAEHQKREEKFISELYNQKVLKEQIELNNAYISSMEMLKLHSTYRDLGLPNAKDPIAALNQQGTGVVNPLTGKNIEMPTPIDGRFPSSIPGHWIGVTPDGTFMLNVNGLGPEARSQYIRDVLLLMKMQGTNSINISGQDDDLKDDIWEEAMLLGMTTNYTPRTEIPANRAVQNYGFRTRPAHETLRERQREQQELTDSLKEIDQQQNGELVTLDNYTRANEDARHQIRLRSHLTKVDDIVETRFKDSVPGASNEQQLIDLMALEEKHKIQFKQMDDLLTDCNTLKSGLVDQYRASQNAAATLSDSTFTQKTRNFASRLTSAAYRLFLGAKHEITNNFLHPARPDTGKSALQVEQLAVEGQATKLIGTAKEATTEDMTIDQAQRVAKLNQNYQDTDQQQNMEVMYLAHEELENQLTIEQARLNARQAKLNNIVPTNAKEQQLKTDLQNLQQQSAQKIVTLTTKLGQQRNDMSNINSNDPGMTNHYDNLARGSAPSVSL